ncbi:unnamed protein product [Prunus brigantina]
MQLIACNITTVQLEVYRETDHGTFCDDDQEYLACIGGCTLGQEGSHDPLECLKFCCGLCERPLGQQRNDSLCAHQRSMIINRSFIHPHLSPTVDLTRMTLTSSYSIEFLVAVASPSTKTRSFTR